MEGLGQAQGQQRLTLAAAALPAPARGGCRALQTLQAEMGREIPVAGIQQRIGAGPLLAVSQQSASRAPRGVVATGLQGVIHHQQMAFDQAGAGRLQPRRTARMEFGAPAARQARRGSIQIQISQLLKRLGFESRPGAEPEPPIRSQDHLLQAPHAAIPGDPLHREGIEHLMGQHHAPHRSGCQIGPGQPAAGEGSTGQKPALARLHAGVGLHEQQLQPRRQIGPAGRQGRGQLQGQLSLPGTGLHQGKGTRTKLQQPVHQLGSQEAGKTGPQARGGGEVAAGTNPQTPRSIGAMDGIMERPLHIGAEGHGTTRRHEPLHQPGGRLR